jgi:hypothetical protein
MRRIKKEFFTDLTETEIEGRYVNDSDEMVTIDIISFVFRRI